MIPFVSHNEISKINDELILNNVVESVDIDNLKKEMSETLILVKLQNGNSIKVLQKYIPKDILLRTLWYKLSKNICTCPCEKETLCTSIKNIIDMKQTSQATREKYHKRLTNFQIKCDDDLPLSSLKKKTPDTTHLISPAASSMISTVISSVATQQSTSQIIASVTSSSTVTTLVIGDVATTNKKRKIVEEENDFEVQEREYVGKICKNIKQKIQEHREIKISEKHAWQNYIDVLTSSLMNKPHIITFKESKKIEINLELLQKDVDCNVLTNITRSFDKYQNWKEREVKASQALHNIYNTYSALLVKYQDVLDVETSRFLQSYPQS